MRIPSALGLALVLVMSSTAASAQSLSEENEALLRQLQEIHNLSHDEIEAVRAVFAKSRFIGQGNPAITVHPATPVECQERLTALGATYENPEFERICGDKYMAPLYDPASQTIEQSIACIDQFEFPDVPCSYPVVWVRASEAAEICEAVGKRLCDAHEWEGACAGALEPPDYRFDLAEGVDAPTGIRRMRAAHNQVEDKNKVWAYGPEYRTGICAATSQKSSQCEGGGWSQCGSNTFPTGFYPECRSSLGVYDLHGNAAEHMNLPVKPGEMASAGSQELGYTEMKGSWFIFDRYKAHEDACRWRAPFWHGSRVMDPESHHNYHLGFRCCKTIGAQ